MKINSNSQYLIICLIIIFWSCRDESAINYENDAVPPAHAISTYKVAEGFQIELIASEPLIADPVDMEIDEEGNMYVVEMSGYPLNKKHTGKIKLLRDEDGDGVMDVSILFADKLMFPNGVLRWKEGILVTDAPYVLYLEDQDGDGVSDKRDTVLTGFSLSNPHVNVNNPIYGLDNWIYLSHFGRIGTRKYEEEFGDLGEEIRFWKDPDGLRLPQNANSKNVRFKADGSGLEMLSVRGQFGHTFDPWGHHFLTHNQNHIYHEVLDPDYLQRNPNVLITAAAENVSDHGNAAEIYQITTNPDRQLLTPVGVTTSTSGITFYAGGLFPMPYGENTTFVAESVSNLVHVDKLSPKGATYTAERIKEGEEFLASTDYWARPVNTYVGPDGALYVVDYYRRIIEHPEWMSDEAVEEGGLYDGHNMGRIYRISPKATPPATWTKSLKLGEKTSAELVKYLSDKNIWWRLNAQRLLVSRQDPTITHLLEEKVKTDDSAYGRLHALWTLEGMNALKIELILQALKDEEGGIRENAIRIAEDYLDASEKIIEALFSMAEDENSKVRFQLLNTLGNINSKEAEKIREKILIRDIKDEWVQLSALTAVSLDPDLLLSAILEKYDKENITYLTLIQKLTEIIGAGKDQEKIVALIREATEFNSSLEEYDWQSSVLTGISDGLRRNGSGGEYINSEQERLTSTFFSHPSGTVKDCALKLLEIAVEHESEIFIEREVKRALKNAKDKELSGETRARMLKFLTLTDPYPYILDLKGIIVPIEEPEVQIAALNVFNKISGKEVSEYVLDNWGSMTPEVRNAALNTFLSEKDRVELLLDALKKDIISKTELGWPRTVQLIQYRDEDIRNEARAILTQDKSEETENNYKLALGLAGDKLKGQEIFITNCSSCHQVRGEMGADYGPDLGTIHNWLPKDILANILNPNLSIAPGFDLWKVNMHNGETLQGMIMSETSSAIELRMGPQMQKFINRNEIKEINVIRNMSMMPGYGGQLNEQEMANLITFLRNSQRIHKTSN